MYTIIGLKKSVGDLTDNSGKSFHYDNVKFYVVDDQNVSGLGQCPDVVSVKSNLIDGVDLYQANFIGKKVEFLYNKYGKVQSLKMEK